MGKSQISPELIIHTACTLLGVTDEVIQSPKRKREVVECRFIIMFLIKHYTDLKPQKIGTFIGYKNRSTVRYGIKTCTDLTETSLSFSMKLSLVQSKLEESCK